MITIDETKATEVGENIKALAQEGKLYLIIDLGGLIGLSKSEKSMGIASTGGFTIFGNQLRLNMYLGKKA